MTLGRPEHRVLLILVMSFGGDQGVRGASPDPSPIGFREIAAEAGVKFRFDTGSRQRHDLPEVMGGGVALIDGDQDGWPDLYFCNGGPIGAREGKADPPCRYYRNQRDGTFRDETENARAPGPSYAMGAAVGDVDGDGRADLFVTGWRDQRLYRNEGGGKFVDITARAGLTSGLWSTSAAFADLDQDGDLDLYVANYLDFDPSTAPHCAAPDGRRDYCGPEDFPAQPDRLYRNNGDGTFTDVSAAAGIALPGGRGLGVLIADLTGDRLPDLFVANDGSACWLFENQGGMRFAEVGEARGVAFDGQGDTLAGMGVAWGDVDDDGRPDLLVSNFYDRSTVAFQALGQGTYRDVSASLGLTVATRGVLGFGLLLEDFDGDGRLDLLQANGHVLDRARLGVPFAMRPTVLRNAGRRFVDAGAGAGPWFGQSMLGRGVAVGDLDRDGRPDVVVNALDRPAAILRNEGHGGRWLVLDLVGRAVGPAVGARIKATVGPRVLVREVVGGGSYLSASENRLFLGLGGASRVDRLEVSWPSGRVETWSDLGVGERLRLEEGSGVAR
ncbi:CRTAC1 family protein [Singulisphaera sp. Ch08]|uniref:CRTAC1 family protein n=1 Tax=Singulisphaera sp. Ch08 TaxID=3120278 RepID=A0AAU7CGX5_9BACT